MSDDVKVAMLSIIEKYIDSILFSNGFQRRKNSFTYSRRIGTVKQKIEMIYFSHPSYHPSALAHIYPWLSVCFPQIDEITKEMVEGTSLSCNLKNATVRQPIQIYTDCERWMLLSDEEDAGMAKSMEAFLLNYTIPLLDCLKCIDDYIQMYETKDKRLIWDDMQYISVVSAYILKNNHMKAKKVMEERFGKTGLRRRYASVFEYIENARK